MEQPKNGRMKPHTRQFVQPTAEFMSRQGTANTQYNQLLQAFAQSKTEDRAYPPYYAGAYIDDDGDLVVLVTQEVPQSMDDIRQISCNQKLKTRLVRHSYNVLSGIMGTINTFLEKYPDHPVACNIGAASLSDFDNNITVGLRDCRPEKIQAFKDACCDGPAIHFEVVTQDLQLAKETAGPSSQIFGPTYIGAITAPGQALWKGSSRASAASRCIRNRGSSTEEAGFITAGHFAELGNRITAPNGVELGVCTRSNFGGTVDGAFVKFNEGNACSFIAADRDSISPVSGFLAQKSYYQFAGSTSGKGGGRIDRTDGTVNLGGQSFRDLYYTDDLPAAGDSGGLMYSEIQKNVLTQTGTVMGLIGISWYNYGLYVKMPNILSMFNLTLY